MADGSPPVAGDSSPPFVVSSWNVLAQSYAHSHAVEGGAKSWPDRGERVLHRLELQAADIIALQEVDHYDDLYRERLDALGYEVHYAHRSGVARYREGAGASASSAPPTSIAHASPADWHRRSASKRSKCDGILIAWKRSRFRLAGPPDEAMHIVDYDDLAFAEEEVAHLDASVATSAPTPSAAVHSAALSQQHAVKFLRHNVGVFVFLQAVDSPSDAPAILVANTHLYWSPMHEDVKLKQVHYFLARMEMECKRRLQTTDSSVDLLSNALDNASLEDGAPSAVSLTSDSAISSFPLILAGDFNSSPLSMLYNYLSHGVYERKALVPDSPSVVTLDAAPADASSSSDTAVSAPSSGPKFLCDSDLTKVAKWLRSIGVDCEHYTDSEKKVRGHTGMFERAVAERRVILTKSLRLLERRNCPPWFLLRSSNLEVAFASLIMHFGLRFDERLFYSRCIFCNSGFDSYPAAYFTGGLDQHGVEHEKHEPFMDIPRGFINLGYKDELGNILTFTRCRDEGGPYVKCGKLFWWGARSGAAVELFQARMEQAINLHHQEDESPPQAHGPDGAAADDKTTASSSHSRSIPHRRQAELRLARSIASHEVDCSDHAPLTHPLRLTSVYGQAPGGEPAFTNLTQSFQDTLDYIFFANPTNAPTLQVHSVRRVTDDANLDLVALEKTAGGDSQQAPPPPKTKREKKLPTDTPAAADVPSPSASAPTPTPGEIAEQVAVDTAASVVASAPAVPMSLVLPNLSWPSDHLLLQAQFTLTR